MTVVTISSREKMCDPAVISDTSSLFPEMKSWKILNQRTKIFLLKCEAFLDAQTVAPQRHILSRQQSFFLIFP